MLNRNRMVLPEQCALDLRELGLVIVLGDLCLIDSESYTVEAPSPDWSLKVCVAAAQSDARPNQPLLERLRQWHHLTHKVSKKVRFLLFKALLCSQKPSTGLQAMYDSCVLSVLSSILVALNGPMGKQSKKRKEGTVFAHSLKSADEMRRITDPNTDPEAWVLIAAALFHDVGKYFTLREEIKETRGGGKKKIVRHPHHAPLGALLVPIVCEPLGIPRAAALKIALLVQPHMQIYGVLRLIPEDPQFVGLMMSKRFRQLALLQRADIRGRTVASRKAKGSSSQGMDNQGDGDQHDQLLSALGAFKPPLKSLIVDAALLLGLDYTPGPCFTRLLTLAVTAQIEGSLTKDNCLNWIGITWTALQLEKGTKGSAADSADSEELDPDPGAQELEEAAA